MDSDSSRITEWDVLCDLVPFTGLARSVQRCWVGEPCILNCAVSRADAIKYVAYQSVTISAAIDGLYAATTAAVNGIETLMQ